MIRESESNPICYLKLPGGYDVPGLCACCGKRATRLLNVPGNILTPACPDPACEPAGALEVSS